MADFDASEALKAAGNPFKVTDPEKIPVQRYFDGDFFSLEGDAVFGKSWQMAARLETIPNVGDWVEYTILGKSVLVVNTKTGVKAYNNHCRHRGVPLAGGQTKGAGGSDHGNCAKTGFICPFHGWRWNMDGDCTFVYGKHLFSADLLADQDLKLVPVRCETWGGMAFVNFDMDALPLADWLGVNKATYEARGIENLRAEWWYGTVLPSNWKIAMEAFQEGYHVMKTHPQLQRATPVLYNSRYGNDTGGLGPAIDPAMSVRDNVYSQFAQFEHLSQGMAGLIQQREVEIARGLLDVDLPDDPEIAVPMWFGMVMDEITRQLRARGENVVDIKQANMDYPLDSIGFVFPNSFFLTFFSSMVQYRIRPLSPETCLFEIWSLTNMVPGAEAPVPMDPVMLPFDSKDFPLIPQQDYSNIPIQQKGLHSNGFEFMRLSCEREGLIAKNHQTIDALIDGRPRDKIAAAVNEMILGFDTPVRVMEF